jgi:tRNA dimethylallyltransferase
MMQDKPPMVLLMGPTASGKTDLAVQLAERLPCEIVSVDSAMVYRGMDIGTAKPGAEVLARAPHHLIDILDPSESYSAARFREDALREIAEIQHRGRIPLLVGGTMLYFQALLHGLHDLPAAAPEVRMRISAEAARTGWPALHRRLAGLDPKTAQRISINDSQRIQRALEIIELSGRTPSEHYRETEREALAWPVLKFALCPAERSVLHARLQSRFEAMMAAGFLDEVARLRQRTDLDAGKPALRAVGYRQLWQHLEGRFDLAEAVARGIHASRQLAKRQITWLKREAGVQWLDPAIPGLANLVAERWSKREIRG